MSSYFIEFAKQLERTHPGDFQHGTEINAHGVKQYVIRKAGIPGLVSFFEPDAPDQVLCSIELARHRGETIVASNHEEIVQFIEGWAIEREWKQPSPIDTSKEHKRLNTYWNGRQKHSYCAAYQNNPAEVEALRSKGTDHPSTENDLFNEPENTTSSHSEFSRLVEALDFNAIRMNFPRDRLGKIALKQTVLLHEFPVSKPPSYKLCLVAKGPERRKDEQKIAVGLTWLYPKNQNFNWEREPWKWETEAKRTDSFDHEVGDFLEKGLTLDALLKRSKLNHVETAALSILQQDQGHILEALYQYDISMCEDLRRLIGGQKIYPEACCAHAGESWTVFAIEKIRSLALWKIGPTLQHEIQRNRIWASQKKSRNMKVPALVIGTFPGQPHMRKSRLMITGTDRPTLTFTVTGSEARLYRNGYERPIDIDLARYQIKR